MTSSERHRTVTNEKPELFDRYGNYTGPEFPEECIADCSASGQVAASVAYWRERLAFVVPRDLAIAWLREFV